MARLRCESCCTGGGASPAPWPRSCPAAGRCHLPPRGQRPVPEPASRGPWALRGGRPHVALKEPQCRGRKARKTARQQEGRTGPGPRHCSPLSLPPPSLTHRELQALPGPGHTSSRAFLSCKGCDTNRPQIWPRIIVGITGTLVDPTSLFRVARSLYFAEPSPQVPSPPPPLLSDSSAPHTVTEHQLPARCPTDDHGAREADGLWGQPRAQRLTRGLTWGTDRKKFLQHALHSLL